MNQLQSDIFDPRILQNERAHCIMAHDELAVLVSGVSPEPGTTHGKGSKVESNHFISFEV
jgi:hypothetical protein